MYMCAGASQIQRRPRPAAHTALTQLSRSVRSTLSPRCAPLPPGPASPTEALAQAPAKALPPCRAPGMHSWYAAPPSLVRARPRHPPPPPHPTPTPHTLTRPLPSPTFRAFPPSACSSPAPFMHLTLPPVSVAQARPSSSCFGFEGHLVIDASLAHPCFHHEFMPFRNGMAVLGNAASDSYAHCILPALNCRYLHPRQRRCRSVRGHPGWVRAPRFQPQLWKH